MASIWKISKIKFEIQQSVQCAQCLDQKKNKQQTILVDKRERQAQIIQKPIILNIENEQQYYIFKMFYFIWQKCFARKQCLVELCDLLVTIQ